MSNEIINKVAQSGLITLDLEEFFPKDPIVVFDLKPYLFMEMILKEKDFRTALQNLDWSVYQDKIVAVTCSTDAIIPRWAYMLVATYLTPIAKDVRFGTEQSVQQELLIEQIEKIPAAEYTDKRVVIKGCGDVPIGEGAYLTITRILRPVVKSMMYGEPCSTVPIFKNK